MTQHFQGPLTAPGPRALAAYPTTLDTARLAALASRLGGLHINPAKTDFFNQRLGKRLTATGKRTFQDYCSFLESTAGVSEHRAFIEALTTHTTSFFREQKHFDWLAEQGWAHLVAGGAGLEWPLKIWSAACSNGSELYSTLISLNEFSARTGQHLRVEGVGTDLSSSILKTAAQAVYSSQSIAGLSEERRRKFLLRARDGSDRFRVVSQLRVQSTWSRINLTDLKQDGPSLPDLILLRNVLIYFDPPTQQRVVSALCKRLRLNGILMTGHSESVAQPPEGMLQVGAAIYRKIAST
jgi:chemotaxis protein methyltransferase CheR